MRLLTALAVALAAAAAAARSVDVRALSHSKVVEISYRSSGGGAVDTTTVCLEEEIPETATTSLVVTLSNAAEEVHAGVRGTEGDTNCAVFADAAMPTTDGDVTYVLVYNAGATDYEAVSSVASFTFEAAAPTDTFTCGGRLFAVTRTGELARCTGLSGTFCYHDVTATARGRARAGGEVCAAVNGHFQYCQPETDGAVLPAIGDATIESLGYDGKIKLSFGGTTTAATITDVLIVSSAAPEQAQSSPPLHSRGLVCHLRRFRTEHRHLHRVRRGRESNIRGRHNGY